MKIKRLDGVRAIATVLLILFHSSFFDLAWTGGELFFVLSGFLMTRILRASRTDSTYWSRFYTKRAVRILPLMFLVLVVYKFTTSHLPLMWLAGYALFMGDLVGIYSHSGGGLAIISEIAVGVHFVLLWSIAVRFLGRRSLLTIALGLLAIEPLLRFVLTPHIHNIEAYVTTPLHLDSIAAGSLLAVLIEDAQSSKYLARWSGWISASLAVCLLGVSPMFPWFIRVTNIPIYNALGYGSIAWIYFFFLAWVWFAKEDGFADRALSWPPLLYISQISYGLVLFHPFVTTTLKHLLHLPFGIAGESANRKISPLAIIISVVLCSFLFRSIQKPMHAWGERQANRLRRRNADAPQSEEEMIRG